MRQIHRRLGVALPRTVTLVVAVGDVALRVNDIHRIMRLMIPGKPMSRSQKHYNLVPPGRLLDLACGLRQPVPVERRGIGNIDPRVAGQSTLRKMSHLRLLLCSLLNLPQDPASIVINIRLYRKLTRGNSQRFQVDVPSTSR